MASLHHAFTIRMPGDQHVHGGTLNRVGAYALASFSRAIAAGDNWSRTPAISSFN